ncbi:uncharacterized protein LOC129753522 [Uranotaenia lowii]|uniref:uncharacterized protein LOC129753522 n=1 Tax=Uranotaenia lowii TaxID=190385 RepID=UPI0024786A6E|nr:uncharacterized protein LOC129753522 [Uranotaenia lowii]
MEVMDKVTALMHRREHENGKVAKIFHALYPEDGSDVQLSRDKILELVPSDEVEIHYQNFKAFEELYLEVSIALEEHSEQISLNAVAAPSPLSNPSALIIHQPLRMPIPTFDGQYESWPKFKAVFKDLVDKSPDSPAVKLYHLEKSLIGKAAGLIDAKTINEGNYDHAWQILEERFENKRHTIDTHITGLFNLKRMAKENHAELRALLDECTRHVESLKYLEQEFTGISELMLVHLLTNALDKDTRRRWEGTIKHGDLPSYHDTMKFLKEQCFVLERCEAANQSYNQPQSKPSGGKLLSTRTNTAIITKDEAMIKCEICSENHANYTCPEFRALSVQERLTMVKEKQMCFNCLRRNHLSMNCPSEKTCGKCRKRHHTLLHVGDGSISAAENSSSLANTILSKTPEAEEVTTAACSNKQTAAHQVLLLTAVVNVLDKNNTLHPCRVLLDSGSQANLITDSMVTRLNLKRVASNVTVAGVNGTKTNSSGAAVVQIRSKYSSFAANVYCLITQQVTSNLPTVDVDIRSFSLPPGIELADPCFHRSDKVDMLLGNQWFLKLLLPGVISLADNLPMFRETQLGWVVGGECDPDGKPEQLVLSNAVTFEELNDSVKKFWEIESVPEEQTISTEESECEEHFLATHQRDDSGRYIVQLPLRNSVGELGDSRNLALRRFFALERRLVDQPELKSQYVEFMHEYEALGHCREIFESADSKTAKRWYLPHHAVLRPSNTTTECRVVFYASAKVNGLSLNDVLKIGAIPQEDLQSIVLRFREPRYVLSADIAKMYRQIRVNECHSSLQRIFWRNDPSQPLRVLELTTVTYGTASAPFLATRALQQLAIDEKENYPLAAEIVQRSFYVDNALFGFDYIAEAAEARIQLEKMLISGGMPLHKWASNCPELLVNIPEENKEKLVKIENFGPNEVIKTLGLMWDPVNDDLLFVSLPTSDISVPTKRQVLSLIARMFDPLGLAAPVILIGKLLMQRLWKAEIEWDENLSSDLIDEWERFREAIGSVGLLKIPRQVVVPNAIRYELHGFADASQNAYGVCVYIRSLVPGQAASLRLLTAKSKLVPKSVLTIPRKELLAALLLHRLVKKVLAAVCLPLEEKLLWSDSQIVLAWLRKSPGQLDVFVRNRVAEIIASGSDFKWNYVRTFDNPADVVSRGQSASQLATNDLWWNGPMFLRCEPYLCEVPNNLPDSEIPELKCNLTVCPAIQLEELPVFSKFENFRKLQRVIAYVWRYSTNIKKKSVDDRELREFPTVSEMRMAMMLIIRAIQSQCFMDEIQGIKCGKPSKRLEKLSPFLDDCGCLRVGGRLENSNLPYATKHQFILPNEHPLVQSLIASLHREHLHAGPSALMAILRSQFWVLSARSTVRKITRSCVQCFKVNPKLLDQYMGDLPRSRTERSPAFLKVGVDFAGPIFLKQNQRKASPVKGYICVFVCLVTKSLHLEVVENLATEAFIACLHRFVGRRGLPEIIFSDNGTNFVGAKHELHQLYSMLKDQLTQQKISEFCLPKEISWEMIPPNAPHMGGIWEAGVKSVKTILKKVTKDARLNFVEFQTLLIRIEALLNSRPLYSNPEDPAEPDALTPGHFIADRPLLAIPEPTCDGIPENRLSRWQYVQVLRNQFWKRWSQEYLTELQGRAKWTKKTPNIRPGMVVLVKDDNLPPQSWKLGIIEQTFPGRDGCVRVVNLRTRNGSIKRPIHKLAPLPILDNGEISKDSGAPGGVCSSQA